MPRRWRFRVAISKTKDRKGDPCKRINCSEFWKGRDSYSRLQDEYYDWLKRFCERNEFPFYGIHQFRHFFASVLVNEGVDIVSVSGALGHSTVATTSGIYCHLLENARARVSDAITNALKFGA